MEWVETTGRTIEEAKEAALDELGVDESEAEFEILQEAKVGLFGRLRSEARVRARVRPTAPRAKEDRRDRRRRPRTEGAQGKGSRTGGGAGGGAPEAGPAETTPEVAHTEEVAAAMAAADLASGQDRVGDNNGAAGSGDRQNGGGRNGTKTRSRNRRRRSSGDGRSRAQGDPTEGVEVSPNHHDSEREENEAHVDVALDEQAAVAAAFLSGLVQEFGLEAEVTSTQSEDEDTLNMQVTGGDLGLLIGPKGATLLALQDLTRTAVQRKTGATNGRIYVDVAGYRQKRSEALARFARQVAEQVRTSGTPRALEPMSAADRKAVHDAVNDIEGVVTSSEGEDPNRRVVISPRVG